MFVKPCSNHVAAVAGGARGNERLKRSKRLNVNGNSTTLRHQRQHRLAKIEPVSIQQKCQCDRLVCDIYTVVEVDGSCKYCCRADTLT